MPYSEGVLDIAVGIRQISGHAGAAPPVAGTPVIREFIVCADNGHRTETICHTGIQAPGLLEAERPVILRTGGRQEGFPGEPDLSGVRLAGTHIGPGRRLDGDTQPQPAHRAPQQTSLKIYTTSPQGVIVLHHEGSKTSPGAVRILNVRKFLGVFRGLLPILRHIVVEHGKAQVEAQIQLVVVVGRHIQEEVLLVAVGLLAVFLIHGRSQPAVVSGITDFRDGLVLVGAPGDAIEHTAAVTHHIHPGRHTRNIRTVVPPVSRAQHIFRIALCR